MPRIRTARYATRDCLACGEPGIQIADTSDYDEPACRHCGARHEAYVTAAAGRLSADLHLAEPEGNEDDE